MDITRMLDNISTPTLPPIVLYRGDLVQTLIRAIEPPSSGLPFPYKLVLLCAPAGYGKTTLLVDTILRISSTSCWYTLDTSDSDPAVFLQRLFASIRRGFPTFGEQLLPLLEATTADMDDVQTARRLETVFDALQDALKNEMTQPFILVFSNYHKVSKHEIINRLVDRLITHLPSKGTVVIESQAIPNFTLAPLIARRQMFGLGTQKLRFTPQQVYELAQLQGITTFSLGEAERLTNIFDGWIAGLLLGSRLGNTPFHHPVLLPGGEQGESMFVGDYTQIMAYITNEVFKHEAATYDFLKQTSILARLTADHCNQLLGINDAAERLAYAEQRSLFIVRDSENGRARDYLCHPVIRRLFSEHLREHAPQDYLALHSKAARILRADHQYVEALAHAYQAQEYNLLADILIERGPLIIDEEQSEAILHWLNMLPEAIFTQYPQLLLIASNIHLRHGEFALVQPLLDRAEALLHTYTEELDQRARVLLQADLLVARSHLSFFQGEFQRTQELCQQALELLPPDDSRLRIRAHQYLGISLIVGSGQVQKGITQLQLALQISRSQQNERQSATLHRLIANAYSWIGNHVLAEYHQTRAYQIWEKLNNTEGIIYGLTSMGLLKMRQGFTQQAEELLQRALTQAQDIAHLKNGKAYALVGLGDLRNNLGQYAEALNYLEDGLSLARSCEDRYLTSCSLCYLALAYLFLGDAQTAHFFLNQVVLKDSEKLSFEGCLFYLTQGTVYLAQRDYVQAEAILVHVTDAARQSSIQIIHVSALLRLTVCYLRQNKKNAAYQTGQTILDLNQKGDFDFLLQVEARRYSELDAFLAQVPAANQAKDEALPDTSAPSEVPAQPQTTLEVIQDQPGDYALQILALGEPRVLSHGATVTRWRMARTMELFFFLLETGRPVRREQIIETLWPEHDSKQIDSTFRTTTYYLRKALGENCILFQSGLYSLNIEALGGNNIWYDVEVFDAQYTQAKKALEAEDDKLAAIALHKMLKLYNGDYVQSFYNDWCLFRRGKLRQAYIDAHHQLALIAWRREDWDDSLQYWQRLLTLDPCHESSHYGIMRCYLQQGKRELALRQFQLCSQILKEELQTTPKASLQKLYRSIIG